MQYGVFNSYDIALRSALNSEETADSDLSAGYLDISWSRKESVMKISHSTIANAGSCRAKHPAIHHFRCILPQIRYTPTDNVQAVIRAPASVTQYSSFQWQLQLTNLHPTMAANDLSIQTEITEGFSWSGSRHVSVPMLLPFQQFDYNFSAIPMTAPGLQPLPRIRVLQSQTEIPREIAIQTRSDVNSEGAVQVMVLPL